MPHPIEPPTPIKPLLLLTLLCACANFDPAPCVQPSPEYGYASLSSNGRYRYWTECLSCPDGSTVARTWGPTPHDGQTGPANTHAPSCDYPGDDTGETCETARVMYEKACR